MDIYSISFRLILALFMGTLIGIDRKTAGHPAGVRTFSFVCLGSCLAMIVGEYLYAIYPESDPSRIAAQVVSGIGFLGVGTIVVTRKNLVHGLSTAASLWAASVLGIAAGSGMILGSVIAFVLYMFVILVLTPISHRLDDTNRRIVLYLELEQEEDISALMKDLQNRGFSVSELKKMPSMSVLKNDVSISLVIDLQQRMNHMDFIAEISSLPYVCYAEEIR